jgi:hypothetical protein
MVERLTVDSRGGECLDDDVYTIAMVFREDVRVVRDWQTSYQIPATRLGSV